MGAITFKSIEQYAKRLGVRVERYRRTYECFKESEHGSVGTTNNLRDLLSEVRDFAVGNVVYLDAAKPVKIIDFEGDDIRVGIEGREDFLVSPDRLGDKQTDVANFGVIYCHTGDVVDISRDLTRREAEESINFLRTKSTIKGRLEYARLIQFLS